MHFKRIASYLLLILIPLIGFSLIPRFITPAEGQAATSDWPQLQHDQQKTGRSNHALVPPFTIKWRWLDGAKYNTGAAHPSKLSVEIPVLVQPIAGDGKIYLGSYGGEMFAINETSGETAWKYKVNGPIQHTAGFAAGKVFFGSSDGYFYALNSSNGSLAWKYNTGSIFAAPLILSDRVCIGSKTNFYYCFSFADQNQDGAGDLLFKFDAKAPIYHSSAASSDGTKIYFGTEDMKPQCILARSTNPSGEVCAGWQPTILTGQSFIHYWPVAVADKVVFTVLPTEPTNTIFGSVDSFFNSISATAWNDVEPLLINHYKNNPAMQTLFVLNGSTGQKAFDTAASHIAYHQDAFVPPTIGVNNEIYLLYRGKQSALGSSFGTNFPPDLGWINPQTGKITPVGAPGQIGSKINNDLDDNSNFTSAPGIVYGFHNRRCVIGIDVNAKTEFNAAQPTKDLQLGHCGGATNTPAFFDGVGESYGFPDIDGYDNRGEGLMGPSIVGNSMYLVFRGGMVFAVNGTRR